MEPAPTDRVPPALAEVLERLNRASREERLEALMDYADRFESVPPEVATRPFSERNRAPYCESEAYAWAVDRPDGTLDFHFAVENPQGISAMAWAVVLAETLSGRPLEEVVAVPPEVVRQVFGNEVSMGKGLGLLGMLDLVKHEARTRLDRARRH